MKIARGTYRSGREAARKAVAAEDSELETYRAWLKNAVGRAVRGEDLSDTVDRLHQAEDYLRETGKADLNGSELVRIAILAKRRAR